MTTNLTAQDDADELQLYAQHLTEKLSRFETILAATGYSELVIAAGDTKVQFQDDLHYPFKANPYFREWLPLNQRPGCFLQIKRGAAKPRLFLLCAEDIWHTAPQRLAPGFEQGFDIVEYEALEKVIGELKPAAAAVAYLGETNSLELPVEHLNPQALLYQIDFQRRYKTAYEQHCVRCANRLAPPAHRAARDAFMAGASELEISAAYLRASNCAENDMPYSIIAGLNENAAVLHHYRLDNRRPAAPRSFLIDAGIDYNGYASDITRTYAYDPTCEFAEMIEAMDARQRQLAAAGAIGKSPVELHRLSHRKIAEVLVQFGLVGVSVDEAMETHLTETFYPHGLGHHLGCNVHDKGTQLANPQGELMPPPEEYPKMRHTVPMVANQIYTVEPGLYFIPSLLDKLRAGEHGAKINWSRVEAFIPYGGIRIEDNVVLHEDGRLENLTRDAFEQAGRQ